MIYLDSCAIVKLAVAEPGTEALRRWLAERSDIPRLSSGLIRVEVTRAIVRRKSSGLHHARQVVRATRRIPITNEILETAAMVQPSALRSQDAIHLATAMSIHSYLTAFVSYDQRLLDAAAEVGLPVASPN